ncbi:alpha/beta fold hydrolase [Planomonospora venezuelensis]|uniref:Pimeloyl-ACP methyl ester carboxylesterase n=1 Tax=Planomonospora venezuelensis TaxID=1999 RepID=A0A841D5Q0_PLAVE|nr:alpha/beta hydrolase [Planomonospora venezuelensis]MBB5962776.1 pimeloyl-ACP methyl ester carboxylesterase [Planomonospora venezuelensis]GIM99429.1 alpha/beta hydrolase [Planomonospora venezuelensis]
MTALVKTADGRTLAVDQSGVPDGTPIFLLHGTPGSRVGPAPRATVLYRMGIRLITYDRPGYGLSDRLVGRSVADVAGDVAAIADFFGIERFAVIGRSGGAPHALACAALLPDRTTRLAALVPLAPRYAEGLDWFEGMSRSNVIEYTAAAHGHSALTALLDAVADEVRADPTRLVPALDTDLPEPDRHIVADFGIRRMLATTFAEALRDSAAGWVDDALAFSSPWGFDPAGIGVPTLLWHGDEDVFSPVGHARWLGRQIPGATVVIQEGAAHFGSLHVLPDILTWLAEG